MLDVQTLQSRHYNRSAQPRKLQPSDRILLLIPTANCKFLVQWQVPFMVAECVGPVNYHPQQLVKWKDTQLYHINRLKHWIVPHALLSVHTLVSPESLLGEELYS